MKILVVDDKQSLSELVSQFLGQSYNVTTTEDGLAALSWMQDGNIPDLIITDLEMPNMDGFELIRKVKESGYFSNIPIIVLSCRDSSSDRIQCLKLGADDYLVKPFNPEELLIRVEKLLVRTKAQNTMQIVSDKKVRLLYVGNDVNMANQFTEYSQKVDFHTIDNPLHAVKWLEENEGIDAILCEKQIPGQTGIEFHKMVRKRFANNPSIPFILVAKDRDKKDLSEAVKNGIDDFYVRPVSAENIIDRVQFLKELKANLKREKIAPSKGSIKEYKIGFWKRSFDILVAGTVLLLASPFLLLVLLAIRLESKGKVYYISKRVGTGYKIFDFYKLRSMYPDAEIP